MVPGTYDFKTQRSGDTVKGVKMTITRTSMGTTTPIDLTGMVIRMQVKKDKCFDAIVDLSSANAGEITIEDAVNGVFCIEDFICPSVKTFSYIHDIEFTYPNGVVETYLSGKFPIQGDVTN